MRRLDKILLQVHRRLWLVSAASLSITIPVVLCALPLGCGADDTLDVDSDWERIRVYDDSPLIFLSYNFEETSQRYAAAGLDSRLYVFHVDKADPVLSIATGVAGLRKAYFAPDGTCVLTVGDEPRLVLWTLKDDAASGHVLEGADKVVTACWAPTSDRFVTWDSNSPRAQVWKREVQGATLVGTVEADVPFLKHVIYSPDGEFLAGRTLDDSGTIRIWRAGSLERMDSLTGLPGRVWAIAYSPDGRYLVAGGERSWDRTKNVILWDAKKLTQLAAFAPMPDALSVEFIPGTDELLVTGPRSAVVLHVPSGRILRTYKDRTEFALDMAIFSPNGQYAITMDYTATGESQKLYLWKRTESSASLDGT